VLVWLVLVAACAWYGLKPPTDIAQPFRAGNNSVQSLLAEYERDNADTRLIFISLEGTAPRELAHASQELAAALRETGQFLLVANGSATQSSVDRSFLWQHRYLLSPAVSGDRFEATQFKAALDGNSKEGLTEDPTDEFGVVTTGMPVTQGKVRHGVWLSQDESRALLLAAVRASNMDGHRHAMHAIGHAHAALSSGTRLEMGGPAVRSGRMMAHFSLWHAGAILLIWVMAWHARRHMADLLRAVASAGAALVTSQAIVTAWYGEIYITTLSLAPLLVAFAGMIALAFARPAAREHPAPIVLPGRSGNVMVVAWTLGAFSLLLDREIAMAQAGLYIGSGVAAAWCTLAWLRVPDSRYPEAQGQDVVARWWAGLMEISHRSRSQSIVVTLAAAVLALAVAILILSADESVPLEMERSMREELGVRPPGAIVAVRGKSEQAALEAAESVVPVLQRAVAGHALIAFDSPSRYLPSESAQLARQAALPDPEQLQSELGQALHGFRLRPEAFKPFFDAVEASRGGAVTRESLTGTSFEARVIPMIRLTDQEWVAWMSLWDTADFTTLAGEIAKSSSGASVIRAEPRAESEKNSALHALLATALGAALLSVLLLRVAGKPIRRAGAQGAALTISMAGVLSLSVATGHGVDAASWIPLATAIGVGACLIQDGWNESDAGRAVVLSSMVMLLTGVVALSAAGSALATTAATVVLSSLAFLAGIALLRRTRDYWAKA
jgi:predicted exporter